MTTIDFSKGDKTICKAKALWPRTFIVPGPEDFEVKRGRILDCIITKGSPFIEVKVGSIWVGVFKGEFSILK